MSSQRRLSVNLVHSLLFVRSTPVVSQVMRLPMFSIVTKNDSKIEFDELRTVPYIEKSDDKDDINCQMVVSRLAEIRFVDANTNIVLSTLNVPYGSSLYFKHGDNVKKGDLIAKWDPFNAVIVSEYAGKMKFKDVIEGITYRSETDETTGLTEKIITDPKDRSRVPTCDIIAPNGEIEGTYNFPCRWSRRCR